MTDTAVQTVIMVEQAATTTTEKETLDNEIAQAQPTTPVTANGQQRIRCKEGEFLPSTKCNRVRSCFNYDVIKNENRKIIRLVVIAFAIVFCRLGVSRFYCVIILRLKCDAMI